MNCHLSVSETSQNMKFLVHINDLGKIFSLEHLSSDLLFKNTRQCKMSLWFGRLLHDTWKLISLCKILSHRLKVRWLSTSLSLDKTNYHIPHYLILLIVKMFDTKCVLDCRRFRNNPRKGNHLAQMSRCFFLQDNAVMCVKTKLTNTFEGPRTSEV